MVLRLHVHVGDVLFLTTCPQDESIEFLKAKIEREFASLFPATTPLVAAAVRDASEYLLPDNLRAGDVLQSKDHIFVTRDVAGGGAGGGGGAADAAWDSPQRLVNQWAAWQAFTAGRLARAADAGPPERRRLVEAGAVDVLWTLCRDADVRGVALPAVTALARLSADTPLLAALAAPGVAAVGALARSVDTAGGLRGDDAATRTEVARRCAVVLGNLCDGKPGRAALAGAGGREALMKLAASGDTKTRQIATSALVAFAKFVPQLHDRGGGGGGGGGGEGKSAGRQRTEMAVVLAGRGGRGGRGGGGGGGSSQDIVDALAALATASNPDVQRFAAETLVKESRHARFVDHMAGKQGAETVKALLAVTRRDGVDESVRTGVAEVMEHLCDTDRGVACVHRAGGLHLLSLLSASDREEPVDVSRGIFTGFSDQSPSFVAESTRVGHRVDSFLLRALCDLLTGRARTPSRRCGSCARARRRPYGRRT